MHKSLFLLIFCISFAHATTAFYIQKAEDLNLSKERYWQLLLHMVDGVSEIDDEAFFLSPEGKSDAKSELDATINALLNETQFDNNATACRFPARKAWLQEHLGMEELPNVECKEYERLLERLAPRSVTLVFPAAHINSPASMFGHTFLRINSKYKSPLLAYAINYAAEADAKKENTVLFAIRGVLGGYYGKYSLQPYYEKLREYRDTEQRDIWEYDLDFDEEETLRMVRHIWELNGTASYYYFFTENCSYNMLWLMEVARPSVHLREKFIYHVIPLESVHAAEQIIKSKNYRASKRSKLLAYEKEIDPENISFVKELVEDKKNLNMDGVSLEQKRLIYEAALEFLESSYSKNSMDKEEYLERFHSLTKARASLGMGKSVNIQTPPNPLLGHRAIRTTLGAGERDGEKIGFLGIRPAYHDIKDSSVGFMRGTQIEFLNLLFSYDAQNKLEVENATLLSIVSFAQRSEFYNSLSWRANAGWNRDSLSDKANFGTSVGGGYSFGNEYGYIYLMLDPFFYADNGLVGGVGGSLGAAFDRSTFMSTNIELTERYYAQGEQQSLVDFTQSFRASKNLQLQLNYNYKERDGRVLSQNEQNFLAFVKYYF